MFHWVRRLFTGSKKSSSGDRYIVRSVYDAAKTVDDNKRHWANADSLSAADANSLEVRQKLRDRARYEYANNGYCQGLVLSLANDIVGIGPSLQILTDDAEHWGGDKDQARRFNRQVEKVFREWADEICLAEKLRTMVIAKKVTGEPFAIFVTNDRLESPISLDIKPVECDLVTDPSFRMPSSEWNDGIRYDRAGNPVAYTILRQHPGSLFRGYPIEFDTYPARLVLHWFRMDRPGQVRGVPEITASLPLFAMLRRYTLATLKAAEIAASFSALLETDGNPDQETDEVTPFSSVQIEHGMMTALPDKYKLRQLTHENPPNTYEMFKNQLLREIGRPLAAPYNIMAGDSSPYNYSSARMDHILYRAAIRVERDDCRRRCLRSIRRAFFDEAIMVPGLLPKLPAGLSWNEIPHGWYWPGFEQIDPDKEAKGDTTRLNNLTTTLAELSAKDGADWEDRMRQRARELKLARELELLIGPEQVNEQEMGQDQIETDEEDETLRRNGHAVS